MSWQQVLLNGSASLLAEHESSPIFSTHNRFMVYSVAAALICSVWYYSIRKNKSNIALMNPRGLFEFTDSKLKQQFVRDGSRVIQEQLDSYPDKPFRLVTDIGIATFLPPKFADEVRNDPRLDFELSTYLAYHGHLPGFECFGKGFDGSRLVQEIAKNNLTKLLNKVTEPLSAETDAALRDIWNDEPDWHVIPLKGTILDLIARISSRVFLGEELCRNPAWLKVTKEYTVDAFQAAYALRMWPTFSRRLVHWFLPSCRKARMGIQEARRVVTPVLENRRREKEQLKLVKETTVEFNDAMEWFEQAAKGGPYDPAILQLMLSMAAIHTTTDLLCQVLTDIAQHQDILEPLRAEIKDMLEEYGWKKAALYNMKLLDSVIKESQRLKPLAVATMRRMAVEDVTLSDGTIVPKGETLLVSSKMMWDPTLHERPDEWDGRRFLNIRENTPGKNLFAQLVTTSPEHIAFGHGQHACPGRFFAANEIKVALIHILTKYDLRLLPGETPKPRRHGFSVNTDPLIKVEIRRREGESVLPFEI